MMKNLLALSKRTWLKFARLLGTWNTYILLSITYILILGVVAILMRIFGFDPLKRKKNALISFWEKKTQIDSTIERHKLQF
jgi:hypothetical protein